MLFSSSPASSGVGEAARRLAAEGCAVTLVARRENRLEESVDSVANSIRFAVSGPDHVEIPDVTVNTTDQLR